MSSSSISQKKSSLPVRIIKGTFFQIFTFVLAVVLLGVSYAAWTTINPSQGASGQPVNQTLVQGIINNINDLNTRLQSINPSGTNLSAGKIQINDVVTEGSACTPDGLVGRNGSGAIFSCQSGIWKKSSGSSGAFWASEGGLACNKVYIAPNWGYLTVQGKGNSGGDYIYTWTLSEGMPPSSIPSGQFHLRGAPNHCGNQILYLCVNGILGTVLQLPDSTGC